MDRLPLAWALGCLLATCVLAASGQARAEGSGSGMAVCREIDRALERGELSAGEAAFRKLRVLTSSPSRPEARKGSDGLSGETAEATHLKCGTPLAAELRLALPDLAPAVRREASAFLTRPSLNRQVDTAHFRIHYSDTGLNMIHGWPSTAYRDSIMAAAERAWTYYHTRQGWQRPPGDGQAGGNGLIDIYVDQLSGVYGVTFADEPVEGGAPNDYTAYLVIDNDYEGFGYADRTLPMKVTVAHEYHHVVQMGYTVGNLWWMENVATFMEDEVYDAIDDNHQYLSCYLNQPYKKLNTTNGCYEYGAFLWPTFISEAWGHRYVRDVQACAGNGGDLFSCFESVFGSGGGSFGWSLAEWDVWNFYTHARDDGRHYAEAGAYRTYLGHDRVYTYYPHVEQRPLQTRQPEATGASVQRFVRNTASTDNRLTVTYRGPACTQQVVVIVKEAVANIFHEHYMSLNRSGDGAVEIAHWDRAEYAHMIVSMPPGCGAGSHDYEFDAVTDVTVSVEDGLSPHAPLYVRTIRLDQNSPNPFGPETRISYRLEGSAPVRLSIHDAAGRQVRGLVNTTQDAGEYSIRWDGRDDGGVELPAGAYFYRLRAGEAEQVRKMVLIGER